MGWKSDHQAADPVHLQGVDDVCPSTSCTRTMSCPTTRRSRRPPRTMDRLRLGDRAGQRVRHPVPSRESQRSACDSGELRPAVAAAAGGQKSRRRRSTGMTLANRRPRFSRTREQRAPSLALPVRRRCSRGGNVPSPVAFLGNGGGSGGADTTTPESIPNLALTHAHHPSHRSEGRPVRPLASRRHERRDRVGDDPLAMGQPLGQRRAAYSMYVDLDGAG